MGPPVGGSALHGGAAWTTRLLKRYARGEAVEDELLDVVHAEPHQLAEVFMREQAAAHTLRPTAPVHEAWMRLALEEDLEFDALGRLEEIDRRITSQEMATGEGVDPGLLASGL